MFAECQTLYVYTNLLYNEHVYVKILWKFSTKTRGMIFNLNKSCIQTRDSFKIMLNSCMLV